ncbi:MAG: transporter substrate-binding domain-containing protein [Oscillospiraceae bacterium]|nr:transporter substrate-binding domain-containing protein [Oscillospiraceae bacterium]
MKKLISVLLVLTMLAALLAGCSGPKAEASGVKLINIQLTEEEYAFGVDKNQPELLEQTNAFISQMLSDGTFEAICNKYFGDGEPTAVTSAELDENKEQLVVATNAMFAPFEYVEGDRYYGIDMEIAAALAEYLGQELVIVDMDFEAVCLSVGQSKCDIAMAGLTVNESRKEHVTFTEPYYQASQVLMVKDSDTTFDSCATAADVEAILSGMDAATKIGVQSGTTGQYYLEGDEDWGFAGFPVTCMGYNSAALAAQDMLNGNISFVMVDEAPAAFIAEAYNN